MLGAVVQVEQVLHNLLHIFFTRHQIFTKQILGVIAVKDFSNLLTVSRRKNSRGNTCFVFDLLTYLSSNFFFNRF